MSIGNAALGVHVFFVISGFLITTLLLREHEATGRISLKGFYIRRAWRILPAYYFYLAVILALAAAGALKLTPAAFASAALFLWDYWPQADAWFLAHLWSLAVEEQFYLLWPAVLLWALRRGGRRFALSVALGVIVASPLVRVLTYLMGTALSGHVYYLFHTRADALMFGALGALGAGTAPLERVYAATSRHAWAAALFLLAISPLLSAAFRGGYLYTVGYTLEGAAILLVLLWVSRNPAGVAGRLLNSRPAVQVGVMSYSIYLWQTLFLEAGNRSLTGATPLVAGATPFNLLCIAALSTVSFYLVERTFLRVRDSVTPPASSSAGK